MIKTRQFLPTVFYAFFVHFLFRIEDNPSFGLHPHTDHLGYCIVTLSSDLRNQERLLVIGGMGGGGRGRELVSENLLLMASVLY